MTAIKVLVGLSDNVTGGVKRRPAKVKNSSPATLRGPRPTLHHYLRLPGPQRTSQDVVRIPDE